MLPPLVGRDSEVQLLLRRELLLPLLRRLRLRSGRGLLLLGAVPVALALAGFALLSGGQPLAFALPPLPPLLLARLLRRLGKLGSLLRGSRLIRGHACGLRSLRHGIPSSAAGDDGSRGAGSGAGRRQRRQRHVLVRRALKHTSLSLHGNGSGAACARRTAGAVARTSSGSSCRPLRRCRHGRRSRRGRRRWLDE